MHCDAFPSQTLSYVYGTTLSRLLLKAFSYCYELRSEEHASTVVFAENKKLAGLAVKKFEACAGGLRTVCGTNVPICALRAEDQARLPLSARGKKASCASTRINKSVQVNENLLSGDAKDSTPMLTFSFKRVTKRLKFPSPSPCPSPPPQA